MRCGKNKQKQTETSEEAKQHSRVVLDKLQGGGERRHIHHSSPQGEKGNVKRGLKAYVQSFLFFFGYLSVLSPSAGCCFVTMKYYIPINHTTSNKRVTMYRVTLGMGDMRAWCGGMGPEVLATVNVELFPTNLFPRRRRRGTRLLGI